MGENSEGPVKNKMQNDQPDIRPSERRAWSRWEVGCGLGSCVILLLGLRVDPGSCRRALPKCDAQSVTCFHMASQSKCHGAGLRKYGNC
jgi:hypothetical protein